MDVTDQLAQPAPPTRPQLTKTPIAHLSPTLEQPESRCFYATVSLVWPYSSSTKSLGLLLAEPDFRLRRSNGQVKAVFHGRVAESVAEQHVGIGDTLCLSLKDSSFVPNDAMSQTPGRNIAWDLHFERGLTLEVDRSSQNLPSVRIELKPPAPHELEPPSTPRLISNDTDSALALNRGSWGSPAFHKSSRKSSGRAVDFAFDPFTEEDGFVTGKGRKRPRYSLQRTEWRVVDEPDSPEEREESMDWENALDAEVDVESDSEKPTDIKPAEHAPIPETVPERVPETVPETIPGTSDMVTQTNVEDPFQGELSVFVKPSMHLAGGLFGKRTPENSDARSTASLSQSPSKNLFNQPTDTPQLRPIPSPGLPIPSPLVSNPNSHQEYFAPFHTTSSTHDVHHALTSDSNSPVQELESIVEGAPEPALHGLPQLMELPEAVQDEGALSYPPPPLDSHQPPNSLLPNSFVDRVGQLPTVDMDQVDSHVVNEFTTMDTITGLEISEQLHLPVSTEHIDGQLLRETKDVTPEPDYEPHMASNIEARDEEVEESHETSPPPVPLETKFDEAGSGEDVLNETGDQNEVQGLHEVVDVYPGTRSGSDSDSQSDVEEEARYDEDAEGEYYHEGEFSDEEEMESVYEDGIEEGPSDYEDNEAHGLPPAQPEIIVLDSDSEEEDASEQPAATFPHHARQRSVSSDVSQSSAEDDREDWSVVEGDSDHLLLEDQESVEYESEDEYEHPHPDQDDRVHESDLEDESSVDISARDDHSEDRSTRDRSVEEAPDGEVDLEPHAESDEVTRPEEEPGSFTDAETHEDQPDSVKIAPSPAEELSPHDQAEEQVQPTLHDEECTSGRMLSTLTSLDGAHDLSNLSEPSEDDRHAPLGDYTHSIEEGKESSERSEKALMPDDEIDEQHTKSLSFQVPAFNPADQQLPTPDPTQEVSSGSKSGPDNDQPAALRVASEQASPEGLDNSLPPVSEEEPVNSEQQVAADGVGVVLPTTELLEDRQDGEDIAAPESTDVGLETPIIVFTKPPVPDRDAHGLRSKLSYFAPLATLADHYNALVDTISVVYEFSPVAKATSGLKDYFMTIYLTDPSMAGTTLQAQIFRRHKSAMPSLAEGQAILLRDFKVQSHNHSINLVSIESSSWAVFDGSGSEAKMTGPPVEYGSEEQAFASGLRRWYSEAGESLVADSQLQASVARDSRSMTPSSVAASEAGSLDGTPSSARGSRRSRRSRRRVTIHELRDGTRYTEVGSPSGQHGIHELRDGTVYANE